MAEETKQGTTKKRTTSKPKVEEPKQLTMEEQVAQMMAMMAQQQQIIMAMLQGQVPVQVPAQAPQTVETKEEPAKEEIKEEVKEEPVKEVNEENKNKRKSSKTKQDLRRTFKTQEIYVMNATQGAVSYQGKNMRYTWDSYGDLEPMSIDDVVNMPKSFLSTPYLIIDDYENGSDVKEDIENVLGITNVNDYKNLIEKIEMGNINKMSIEDFSKVVKSTKNRGYDITLDLAILIQHKIDRKELTNYNLIGELSKLLGRKFL